MNVTVDYRDVKACELNVGDRIASVFRWVTWKVIAVPVLDGRKMHVAIEDGRCLTFDRFELVEIVERRIGDSDGPQ